MLRNLTIAIFFVAPFFPSEAQRWRIDSLQSRIENLSDDSLIITSHIELGWAYRRVDLDSAKYFLSKARSMARSGDDPKLYNYTLNESGVFSRFIQDSDSIVWYHQRALERAILIDDYPNVVRVLNNLPYHYTNTGRYDKSLNVLDEIEKYLITRRDSAQLAFLELLRGDNFNFMGRYQESLSHYFRSVELYGRNEKDKKSVYNSIAIIYKKLDNPEKALEYYEKALSEPLTREDSIHWAATIVNIGLLEKDRGHFEQAESLILQSYNVYNKTSLHYPHAVSAHNLASVYKDWGKAEEALRYFDIAQALSLKNGYDDLLSKNENGLAHVYMAFGDLKKAAQHGESGLKYAYKIHSLEDTREASRVLYRVYEKLGLFDKAFKNLKTFQEANDSLLNIEKSNKIAELQARFDVKEKENELLKQNERIEFLKKDRAIFRSQMAVLLILLSAIVIISLLIYKRQQTKKQLAEAGLLLVRQKERSLSHELTSKNQEIVTMALQIVERNDFLEKLNQEIKKLTRNGAAGQEKAQELSRQISEALNLSLHRKEFNAYISSVHDAFLSRLSEKFPELSENEKRLAILLRLNLSSKEIAALMNISPKSVDMNRYRLRKKINLDNDQKLNEFIREV